MMNMEKKGRLTLPTDVDMVEETMRLQELLGADAPELLKTGQGITAVSTILILVSSF